MDSLVRTMQELLNLSTDSLKGNPKIQPTQHLKCLALYDEGWKQNGFEFLPNSNSIVTFWIKGDERTHVTLTFREQQHWIKELDNRKRRGEI